MAISKGAYFQLYKIQKIRSNLTKMQHKQQQFMLLWTKDWIMLMHYCMGYQNV